MQLKQVWQGFSDLFFPNTCVFCGNHLLHQEEVLCSQCLYTIPKTNIHDLEDNKVASLFWGRTKLEKATACFQYSKGNITQALIHKLKYYNQKDIGVVLGSFFGSQLMLGSLSTVDYIIPVPLHKWKEKRRGFNQSAVIGMAMAESMGKECLPNALIRLDGKTTQTRKGRFERWLQVENRFQLQQEEKLENKHVLLVDDVVTTGATIEACCEAIKSAKGIKISLAALAVANQ